jgi:hypothetical protein
MPEEFSTSIAHFVLLIQCVKVFASGHHEKDKAGQD